MWHLVESVGFDLIFLSHIIFLPCSLVDLLELVQASGL